MNPYLQQRSSWHDFHQAIIAELRKDLSAQVRPKYLARMDEIVYIHELTEEDRLIRPELSVAHGDRPLGIGSSVAVAELEAPVFEKLMAVPETISESFIEIRDSDNREIATVIA